MITLYHTGMSVTLHQPTWHNIPENLNLQHTGRFIMYSGITKIYYRKKVGQVFAKPVQIEGTTEKFFSQ